MKAILGAAVLALAAGAAGGAAAADDPPAIKALSECGAIGDVAQKAACYDTAMAGLTKALKSGEIVVVQRKEAQAAQRGAFGFNMPSLAIFDKLGGGGKDDDRDKDARKAAKALKAEDGAVRDENGALQSITAEVKRASRDPLDKWVFELADGAVWRQTDTEVLAPSPRAGSKVEIKRAAMGSYLMKVDGQRPIRVRRSE